MHAAEREDLIRQLLREKGFVSFKELDRRLTASAATVRRDLDRLESAGALLRVRGGAKAVEKESGPTVAQNLRGPPFHENVTRHRAEKAAIGAAAAKLCRQGEAIIIDGGSTTLQMCQHLDGLNLQVLTNSLHIVTALMPQQRTRISVPAGAVFREQNIILSPFDDDGTAPYRASKMFLGAASVGRHGLMQTDVLLLQAERRLINRAEELVLLVDSSKFEASAGHTVCGLDEVDIVVTDGGVSADDKRMLKAAGIKVIIADK